MSSFEDRQVSAAACFTARSGVIGEKSTPQYGDSIIPAAATPPDWSDEELALVHIFRLVNSAAIRGSLTPVEKALLAGAQATLQALCQQCEGLLAAQSAPLSKRSDAPRSAPAMENVRGRKKQGLAASSM
jgi:hypothetical protein